MTLDYLGLRDSVEVVVGTNPDISLVSIFAEGGATCGLDAEGKAHCWGGGYGWTHAPLPGGLSYSSMRIGGPTHCGITTEREVYCRGSNDYGELGNGDRLERRPSTVPIRVPGTK